jgi:hypothetical protein
MTPLGTLLISPLEESPFLGAWPETGKSRNRVRTGKEHNNRKDISPLEPNSAAVEKKLARQLIVSPAMLQFSSLLRRRFTNRSLAVAAL